MTSSIVTGARRWPWRPWRRPARRPAGRGFGVGAPFENGAAWRLPARRVAASFLFQLLVLALQSLARPLRFLELKTETIDFPIEIVERWGLWLARPAVVRHAPVMPESARQYKRNPLTSYHLFRTKQLLIS